MQSKVYDSDRVNGCTEYYAAIIQMDFVENFICNYQDDVAGEHWRSTSVTIYTTTPWFRDNSSVPMHFSQRGTKSHLKKHSPT